MNYEGLIVRLEEGLTEGVGLCNVWNTSSVALSDLQHKPIALHVF